MDLVTPAVEEVVSDGEEESEENGVGWVKREWESIQCFRGAPNLMADDDCFQ